MEKRSDPFIETSNQENRRGTSIAFKPDPEIFTTTRFDSTWLAIRLHELAYLNPGLQVILRSDIFHVRNQRDRIQVDVALRWLDPSEVKYRYILQSFPCNAIFGQAFRKSFHPSQDLI